MKKYILNIAAILAMTLVASCTKDQPTNLPNYTMDEFPAIVEVVESPVSFSAKDGNYELVVSGITEAHSHNDIITLTAILNTYENGVIISKQDVTTKCVWNSMPKGIASSNGGKYTSVYNGSLTSKNKELAPGIIAESQTNATVELNSEDYNIKINVPIVYRQTIHIGFDIETRKRENDGLWEFQAVATYPVPYTTNISARCGHSSYIDWQLNPNTTYLEYLTDPNGPIMSAQEAQDNQVLFVTFNERNQSNRFYDDLENICYFVHPRSIRLED